MIRRDPSFDVARGLAIVMVAYWHATSLTLQGVGTGGAGLSLNPWLDWIGAVLAPARMPTLMLVAGVFGREMLDKLGAGSFLRNKLVKIGYPAAIWLVIFALLKTYSPFSYEPSIAEFLGELVWPSQNVWFLQYLVLFFVVLAVARRHMIWICLLSGGVVVADYFLRGEANRFMYLLHFFSLGALVSRSAVSRLLAVSLERLLAVGLPLLVVCAMVAPIAGGRYTAPALVVSYASIAYFLALSAAFARSPRLSRPFLALGRRSLEVYLLHWPVQLALCVLLLKIGGIKSGDTLFAILLAAGAIGGYAAAQAMNAIGLGILFRLPERRIGAGVESIVGAPGPTRTGTSFDNRF